MRPRPVIPPITRSHIGYRIDTVIVNSGDHGKISFSEVYSFVAAVYSGEKDWEYKS